MTETLAKDEVDGGVPLLLQPAMTAAATKIDKPMMEMGNNLVKRKGWWVLQLEVSIIVVTSQT